MDIGAILMGVAVLIVAAFLISQPLVDWRQQREKPLSEADRLREQKSRILAALRDLDFDHASGKVQEDDYAPRRAELVAEGAAVLKQLDELKPAGLEAQLEQAIAARRQHSAPAAPPADDDIERAIAARRRHSAPAAPPADDDIERAIAARRRHSAPAAPPADDDIEQAIAARRKSRPAAESGEKIYCSQCGQAALPGDKFCAKCGAKLLGAPSTKDSA